MNTSPRGLQPAGPQPADPQPASRRAWPLSSRVGILAVGIAIVFIVPVFGLGGYGIYLWSLTLVYLLPAAGLNLMLGYSGQISLAQGAFVGVGAYTVAVLAPHWPLWASLPLGTAIGFVLGVLLGIPSLRLRHHYLAMITLAANQVFVLLVSNAGVTGGALGIMNIPRPSAASSDTGYHIVVAVIAGVAMLALFWVLTSPWGRAFKGIRENEQRAASIGVSVRTYKLIAFAIGSAMASLGGALLAPLLGFIDPTSFSLTLSLEFLMIVVLGGQGRYGAALLGTVLIVLVPEAFRATGGLLTFFSALVTLLVIMFFPSGLAGAGEEGWRRVRAKARKTS